MADDEDEKHKEMRKLLLEIHRNPALTMKEKANLQQKLLSTSYSNRDKPKCRSSKTSSQATAGFPLPPAFSHACECVCSCPENITGQRTTLSCSGGCLASSCPAKLSSDTDCTRQLSSSPPSMAIARSASVLSPSYSNEEKHIFGCEHYPRGCMILAACCRQFFPCRWCHDEAVSGHKINRYNTEMMWCMYCTTVQSIAQSCCNPLCPSQMANGGPGNLARYYCDVCKFHDDTPDKQIYHCPDCAICRIGEGLGEKLFHCHKCCIDLPISFKNNHVCIDKKDSQCVICLEDILTSRLAAVLLKCGHSMHSSCYQDYARQGMYNIFCPVCKKTILGEAEAADRWNRYRIALAAQKMPDEYKDSTALITCNDCEKKSTAPYHFAGHECQECGSFNTGVLETYDLPSY